MGAISSNAVTGPCAVVEPILCSSEALRAVVARKEVGAPRDRYSDVGGEVGGVKNAIDRGLRSRP